MREGGNKFLGRVGVTMVKEISHSGRSHANKESETHQRAPGTAGCVKGALIVEETFGCQLLLSAESVRADNGGGRRRW